MTRKRVLPNKIIFCFVLIFFGLAAAQAADSLPSWNDGKAKQSIIEFVTQVTKEGSNDFVPPAERIATFDNDGTLCDRFQTLTDNIRYVGSWPTADVVAGGWSRPETFLAEHQQTTPSGHSDRSEATRFARLWRRAKWETRSAVPWHRALSKMIGN